MSARKSVLIVGVGSIGERHLRCFSATGRADVSICELNPALRTTVAERYGVARVDEDFHEALRAGPDAVVICAPAHLHISLATSAVLSGAHVLTEKPLSTSLEGVAALHEEVARRGVTAVAAYVHRANPALAAMRDAIASGRFGEPVEIVATCGQNFPFYRPAYRNTYYRDRATGGGAVQDALTHLLNAGEWLVGPVDRLVADIDHLVLDGVSVEDTAHVLTRHGAVMGSFNLNQHQAPNELTITVICRRGAARYESHENRWSWMTEPGGAWRAETFPALERDTLFTRQAIAFLDAIDGARPPLCTLEEAEQSLRVNLAILASASSGRWQTVEVKEVIHG